jgi:hypothetical protein
MRYRQNYKEKLQQDMAAKVASGLVSEHYTGVSNIELRMTYYHRSLNPVLMERTLSFLPASYALFHLKCMHDGCADGGYDLAPVVAAMVKAGKKSTNGKIFCHGTNDTVGHASIAYEVSIRYHRRVE